MFKFDLWIVPVHLNVHWAMMVRAVKKACMPDYVHIYATVQVVDVKNKIIRYSDSMDCSSGLPYITRMMYVDNTVIKEYDQ